MKYISLIVLLLVVYGAKAQVDKDSDLFKKMRIQDSTFFERSFNLCDMEYLKGHISKNLKFYHDQGGFQDRKTFLSNTQKYICPHSGKKPIRKVDVNSLEVFPLYNNGQLYGVIQQGIHRFYLRESGKEDTLTSVAKFTHVWVLENDIWQLSEVLSYDHEAAKFTPSGQ